LKRLPILTGVIGAAWRPTAHRVQRRLRRILPGTARNCSSACLDPSAASSITCGML